MSYYITISRQYGCGGRLVGKALAEKLGIPYYDRDGIVDLIAEDCGLARESVLSLMDRRTSSLLYDMVTFGPSNPLEDQVFLSKTRVINRLADQGSCVIVGSCADYVLRDRGNLLKVFLYGSTETRLERATSLYGDKETVSENKLKAIDKKRADYYKFFTSTKWGSRENYDLLLNTDLGIDEVATVLERIARASVEGK